MVATVNGWALSGPRSQLVHAVPMPTDLGDHGMALCGKRPSARLGWIEREQDQPRRACSDCERRTQ